MTPQIDQKERLDTITTLISAMLKSYDGSPSLHSVAPFLALMRLWLYQDTDKLLSPYEE